MLLMLIFSQHLLFFAFQGNRGKKNNKKIVKLAKLHKTALQYWHFSQVTLSCRLHLNGFFLLVMVLHAGCTKFMYLLQQEKRKKKSLVWRLISFP